jgi:hypothetical protein
MNLSPTSRSCSKLIAAPILLGALFGAGSIIHSLHQGQLSVPITFDDIIYFVDGATRLQSVYDHGLIRLLRDYLAQPPHAPMSTLIAFLAFAFMGMRDWAPAAFNTLWLILLLGGIRWAMREQPLRDFLLVAAGVLAWPLTGHIIIESRPDIVNGLLVAFGVIRLTSRPWVRGGNSNLLLVSAVFGLALLSKPSVSPVTFILYAASLGIGSLLDIREARGEVSLREAVLFGLKSIGIVALIAGPHYMLSFKETLGYIWVTTFGAQKDLWALKMPWHAHLTFYLWGEGAKAMMGPWLFITIASLAAAGAALRSRGDPLNPRLLGTAVVFLLAFLLVSIPAHKSRYLGVVVPCLLLLFFVQSWATLLRLMEGAPSRRAVAVVVALACVPATALFHWHWYFRSSGAEAVEDGHISKQRHALLDRVAEVILSHRSRPIQVYFPVISSYLTSENLQFHFLKQHITKVNTHNDHRSGALEVHLSNIRSSTHVVLLAADDPDTMRWLPSFNVYAQVRAYLESDPQAWHVTRLDNARGDAAVLVFSRPDAFDIQDESGFQPLEGPYPQWNLPAVRWTFGKEAAFRLKACGAEGGTIRFVAQSPLPDQEFTVRAGSRSLGTCRLPEAGRPYVCELAVTGLDDPLRLRLEFARSQGPEDAHHAVLFQQIRFFEASKE